MIKPATLIACLALTAALTGCGDETTECPAPVAEPANTVTTAAPALPAPSAKPAAPPVTPAVSKPAAAPKPVVADRDDADCGDDGSCDVDADLYVKRLVLARGVDQREPVQPATTFAKSQGKRIYAFVEVGNRGDTASEIFVSFKRKGGQDMGRIRLRVGASPRWRTWAYTELASDTGEWEAVVRNARGEVIGTQTFVVTDVPLSDDPYEDPAPLPATTR